MAHFTAPPNQTDLVLDRGDRLLVEREGLATNTLVNMGGRVDVAGGVSDHTTIDLLGVERVDLGGVSNDSLINRGGREIVEGATSISNGTNIVGGVEVVDNTGHANDTTIGGSGRLELLRAYATNVTFADQGRNSVELTNPAYLKGTITNWHVGDFVDLLGIKANSVSETGNVLTVTYGEGRGSEEVAYTLAGQQPDTHFVLRNDGHGGTDIVLVAGLAPLHHHDFLF